MAARDAVKRVPEIARNHCPTSAKCAGVQVTRQMKPGLHLFIDHFVDASFKKSALAKLPAFTVCFLPDDLVTEAGGSLFRLPWKKRLPIFLTDFAQPVLTDSASEIYLSASDF